VTPRAGFPSMMGCRGFLLHVGHALRNSFVPALGVLNSCKETEMRILPLLASVAMVAMCCSAVGQTAAKMPSQTATAQDTVRVFVQGDSSRLPDFIESCKREFSEHGMKLQLVRPDEGYDYNIVVAQESSLAGAAATVIALDSKGLFVASVVRSGRWSGKGAFNASAKELAKKLAALRNH
jgi:uncharacterized lipoprotein YajG